MLVITRRWIVGLDILIKIDETALVETKCLQKKTKKKTIYNPTKEKDNSSLWYPNRLRLSSRRKKRVVWERGGVGGGYVVCEAPLDFLQPRFVGLVVGGYAVFCGARSPDLQRPRILDHRSIPTYSGPIQGDGSGKKFCLFPYSSQYIYIYRLSETYDHTGHCLCYRCPAEHRSICLDQNVARKIFVAITLRIGDRTSISNSNLHNNKKRIVDMATQPSLLFFFFEIVIDNIRQLRQD